MTNDSSRIRQNEIFHEVVRSLIIASSDQTATRPDRVAVRIKKRPSPLLVLLLPAHDDDAAGQLDEGRRPARKMDDRYSKHKRFYYTFYYQATLQLLACPTFCGLGTIAATAKYQEAINILTT